MSNHNMFLNKSYNYIHFYVLEFHKQLRRMVIKSVNQKWQQTF